MSEENGLPEWARLIGDIAFLQMIHKCGGAKYRVPGSLSSDRGQELATCIGEYHARLLIETYGNDRFYVPSDASLDREKHKEVIKAMNDGGMSPKRISQIFEYRGRYTERQIQRILKGA